MARWIVLAVIAVALVPIGYSIYAPMAEYKEKVREMTERTKRAMAMYRELCKQSGVRIYRTVKDVDGIVLLRVRPQEQDTYSQYGLDDPYGYDLGGEGYIHSFLRGFNSRHGAPPSKGYAFVEVVSPEDGRRYRYEAKWTVVGRQDAEADGIKAQLRQDPNYDLNIYENTLFRSEIAESSARYGVTYSDLSTPEQKKVWIAGSSLQIIDLESNELIAERVGYMIDGGQGSKNSGRNPWLHAADNACPVFYEGVKGAIGQRRQTPRFVHGVLLPAGITP